MEGETTMKIIARVERVESGDYVLRGKVFDSFLAARREMLETMRWTRLRGHAAACSQVGRAQLAVDHSS
jgi:hypothetical protein